MSVLKVFDGVVYVPVGSDGAAGANGVGVPTGGTTGQVLAKVSGTDYDAGWTAPTTPAWKGCVLTRQTSAQSIPNTTVTAVQFNSDDYDSLGWHDPVTNNTRITPNVAGFYDVRASADFAANATGVRVGYVYLNGVAVARSLGSSTPHASVDTTVSVGTIVYCNGTTDYLEIYVQQTSGGALNLNFQYSGVTVSLVGSVAPAPAISNSLYACVSRGAVQTVATSTVVAMTFPDEDLDVGGWHDSAINPTRLTVPAGITCVQMTGTAAFAASATGLREVFIYKNGSFVARLEQSASGNGGNTMNLNLASGPVACTEGDYFELMVYQNSGSTLDSATSRFTITSIS